MTLYYILFSPAASRGLGGPIELFFVCVTLKFVVSAGTFVYLRIRLSNLLIALLAFSLIV
jgi:hypothetical protein